MSFDLPEHIQSLNSIASPQEPSHGLVDDNTLWSFLNADMFGPFSHASGVNKPEDEHRPAPTPAMLNDLAVAQQAQQHQTGLNTLAQWVDTLGSDVSFPQTWSYTATPAAASTSNSVAQTPADGVNPTDLAGMGVDKITGARKLKQLGMPTEVIQEDKRKRNTEASARFRQKKKEREQALEKHAQELQGQVDRFASENEMLKQQNALLLRIVGLQSGKIPEEMKAQLSSLKKE